MSTSTLPIDSPVSSRQSTAPSQGASPSSLDANDFLTLLTTELQNQDPLQPMDDAQSVAQLAQFSALQAQNQLVGAFQNFQSNFGVLQASSLIGKAVTVSTPDGSGNISTQTGTVGSIEVQNGKPFFTLNGSGGKPITDNNGQPLLFSTQQIVGIGG